MKGRCQMTIFNEDYFHLRVDDDIELTVFLVENEDSDLDGQYVVALPKQHESFFDTDLNYLAEAIITKSKTILAVDAVRIQNALAEEIDHVGKVNYDSDKGLLTVQEV